MINAEIEPDAKDVYKRQAESCSNQVTDVG